MANNKIKRFLIAFVITLLLIISLTCFVFDKDSINNATYNEIKALNGLDSVLSERVITYIELNPNVDIDDLINVYGIGEKRLEILKKEFK